KGYINCGENAVEPNQFSLRGKLGYLFLRFEIADKGVTPYEYNEATNTVIAREGIRKFKPFFESIESGKKRDLRYLENNAKKEITFYGDDRKTIEKAITGGKEIYAWEKDQEKNVVEMVINDLHKKMKITEFTEKEVNEWVNGSAYKPSEVVGLREWSDDKAKNFFMFKDDSYDTAEQKVKEIKDKITNGESFMYHCEHCQEAGKSSFTRDFVNLKTGVAIYKFEKKQLELLEIQNKNSDRIATHLFAMMFGLISINKEQFGEFGYNLHKREAMKKGQFPTPLHICELMALLFVPKEQIKYNEKGEIDDSSFEWYKDRLVYEPCVGTVYVLNKEGIPLMPCRIIKARHLLKSKRAKITNYQPFTIQLNFECENKVQDITLGTDLAGKQGGLSAVSGDKELYSAEFKIRGQEAVKLISTRRHIMSKLNSHLQLIKKVCEILPINKTIIEVAKFDIQKMKNPHIKGIEYRQGEQLGWENVKSYVRFRDKYQCQAKKTCKNKNFEVHHLETRMTGGNAPNNFLTLCKEHHQEVTDKKRKLEIKRGQSYRHASYLNMMRLELVKRLKELYKNVQTTYGYLTKSVRKEHDLEKSHRIDALCITGNPSVERAKEWWIVKQVRKKKRSLHEADPRKDKVRLGDEVGFISGFGVGKKVVYVRDIENKSVQISPKDRQTNPNYLKLINRNNN
ncbi:8022_t:CDS:2, partial [Funneliformis geosporum]